MLVSRWLFLNGALGYDEIEFLAFIYDFTLLLVFYYAGLFPYEIWGY